MRDFFKTAPPEMRHLSGGADVARLADGRWVIIEFNFGASSVTMWPGYFPIESKELWVKRSLDDISVTEVGRWLRNRHLDDWAASKPTQESGDAVLTKIRSLFDGVVSEGNEEVSKLIEGAELFVRRKLMPGS